MAQKIVWRKKASDQLINTVSYLSEEWSFETATHFIDTLERKLDLLTKFPYMGRASDEKPAIRRLVITPQNVLFYRIKGNKLIILQIMDSRMEK